MTTIKLAFRNLIGAGMKTWLRVAVLSVAFVVIIGLQGVYRGMSLQASQAMIAADIGGGQYWRFLPSWVRSSTTGRQSPSWRSRASFTRAAASGLSC
jgi:hypothetical protein